MTKIVIEVDDTVGKRWRLSSEKRKKEIMQKMNLTLNENLMSDSNKDFIEYLTELRAKMKERGLTEEALNEILNDND